MSKSPCWIVSQRKYRFFERNGSREEEEEEEEREGKRKEREIFIERAREGLKDRGLNHSMRFHHATCCHCYVAARVAFEPRLFIWVYFFFFFFF